MSPPAAAISPSSDLSSRDVAGASASATPAEPPRERNFALPKVRPRSIERAGSRSRPGYVLLRSSVVGATRIVLGLLRLECGRRSRLTGPRWRGAPGRGACCRLLGLLERVEALLDRAHTAVERIDCPQFLRDVLEPLAHTVLGLDDDATREADEPAEGVLAAVNESRDDVLVLGTPLPRHAETIARSVGSVPATRLSSRSNLATRVAAAMVGSPARPFGGPRTARAPEPCANGCETSRRGGSDSRGRRSADRLSGRGRGRTDRPCARAFRFLALVAAGPRAVGGASVRLPARPAAARTAVSSRRADGLAWPLARRGRARERRSRRSFARRSDRG